MAIPFFWPALGFALGILLYLSISLPEIWVWVGFGLSLFLLWLFRTRRIFPLLLVFAFACLGFLFSKADRIRPSNAVESYAVERNEKGKSWIWLEGRVLVHPEIKQTGRKKNVSFLISAERFSKRKNHQWNQFERHRVTGKVQVFLMQPSPPLPQAGDWVRVAGNLEFPKPVLNPGGFDYKNYLASQNIFCILNGYGKGALRILPKKSVPVFDQMIFKLQKAIALKMESLFKGDIAILFKALLLGTRRGLSDGLKEDFYRTGTSHLLAISGLNISLVAGSLYLVGLLTGMPQKVAAFVAFMMTIIQVLIAGFGMPVARAGIMAGIGFWAVILNRERNSLNAFFLAFLVLLILDTRSLESISFQLSFLSVFALMVFMGNSFSEWRWAQCFSGSLAILVVTFPMTVFHFNSFVPVSLLANIVAVPLFNLALLTVLIALVSPLPFFTTMVSQIAELFLKMALSWIHLWAFIPGGYLHVPEPAPLKIIFYYGFLTALALIKVKRWEISPRWIGLLASGWLVSSALFFWPIKSKNFELTLFSAGRNEIAALDFSGNRWLINTGRDMPSRQAEWILTPYFRSRGIQKLSGILLSDLGRKHTGGLQSIVKQFELDYLLFPGVGERPFLPGKVFRKIERHGMNPGARIRIKEEGEIRIIDVVDGRLLFMVTFNGKRFLFLPAVNNKIVQSIQSKVGELSKIDFLVLPAFYSRAEPLAQEIIELLQPERVSGPFLPPSFREFLRENKIYSFSLESEGSLNVSLEGKSLMMTRGV